MINPDFKTAFAVARTPEEVFNAIKNPRAWWSEAIEGPTENVGDEFTHR